MSHINREAEKSKVKVWGNFQSCTQPPLYQQKQEWQLTVAQIMNSLLPYSDLN